MTKHKRSNSSKLLSYNCKLVTSLERNPSRDLTVLFVIGKMMMLMMEIMMDDDDDDNDDD